jgi:HEAT repeat protein
MVTIAAAGAITFLVQLLGGSPDGVRKAASSALAGLADDANNCITIGDAGAIPILVQLLGPGSATEVQQNAAETLSRLAAGRPAPGPQPANAENAKRRANAFIIAAAGAIPLLLWCSCWGLALGCSIQGGYSGSREFFFFFL